MPFIYKENGVNEEIPSVRDYLLHQTSTLYTTMRRSADSAKVLELEMHLDRLKSSEGEVERIKEMLKGLDGESRDLRITLIRGISGFEMIYEEMPRIEIESCQVEVRRVMRQNAQEKNSQWIK